jgi:hypothetical protein
MSVVRPAVLVAVAICCCLLAGCVETTEDQSGNLQSVGLPGMPLWKSKTPPAPLKLTDMGMTPEEAARVSGQVLVLPPDQSMKTTRFRYYQTGHNNCQQDVARLLAQRAASNASGDPPYCTATPTAPPSKADAFVF